MERLSPFLHSDPTSPSPPPPPPLAAPFGRRHLPFRGQRRRRNAYRRRPRRVSSCVSTAPHRTWHRRLPTPIEIRDSAVVSNKNNNNRNSLRPLWGVGGHRCDEFRRRLAKTLPPPFHLDALFRGREVVPDPPSPSSLLQLHLLPQRRRQCRRIRLSSPPHKLSFTRRRRRHRSRRQAPSLPTPTSFSQDNQHGRRFPPSPLPLHQRLLPLLLPRRRVR
jgi:hypothetical protein